MSSVARDQLISLTDLQKECHTADDEREEISSHSNYAPLKRLWYYKDHEKMTMTIGNDNVLKYEVNRKYHELNRSYLRQVLPSLKVKEEYEDRVRISWSHSIGSNIVRSSQITSGGRCIQRADRVYHDSCNSFLRKPNTDQLHVVDMGMI